MKVLALALDDKVTLGLGLVKVEAKAKTFSTRLRPCGCSADTHGVTWQSAISCLGMLQRLACELDVSCRIIRFCEVQAAV